MKFYYIALLLLSVCVGLTSCNKKESTTKNKADLPQNAQTHLETCTEGCKTYVQLVSLGGQTYFYLGYNVVSCDPNPNRVLYLEITGEPVVITSELHEQLKQNGILLNEIYNCDDQ